VSRYFLECECGQPLEFDSALFDRPWTCPHCGRDFVVETPEPASAPARAEQPSSLPWTQWPRIGVIRAAARTAKQVLTNPAGAFQQPPQSARAQYWSYFLVMAVFTVAFAFFLQAPTILSTSTGLVDANVAEANKFLAAADRALAAAIILSRDFLDRVALLPNEIILAALSCVFLRLFGPLPKGTFREVLMLFIFCTASALPLVVLPAIGPFFFVCWGTYCKVVAIRSARRTTNAPAIAAVLAPMILLLFVGSLVVMQDPAAFQEAMRNR